MIYIKNYNRREKCEPEFEYCNYTSLTKSLFYFIKNILKYFITTYLFLSFK